MKNFFIYFILLFPILIFAQSATKWQKAQAEKISSYVTQKLNLNDSDALFFEQIQLAQIVENSKKIKESGASSPDEKKVIYKQGYSRLKEKLTEKFGNKLAQEILKASNEARKM